jgi:FkbM family methyltransferase
MRKAAIESLRKFANSRGVELIQQWKVPELPLVNHLKAIFDKFKIDTVIDVGANQGQYHDMIRDDVGYSGLMLSFEPVSKYAKIIQGRAESDQKWKIFHCALGSAPGTAKINVMNSPGLNSFLAPKEDAVPGFWKGDPVVYEEEVEIRTLDDVLAAEGIDCSKRSVYLKIDTQGFDMEVIKGGPQSLAHVKAMQTEASVRPIYENMPTYLEAIETITGRGFDLSSMFPVTYDGHLRAIEFDCIFTRKV